VVRAFAVTIVEKELIALPPDVDIADLVAALVHAGVRVRAVEPVRQTLEEIYLSTVGSP
jgi:hypothetical protein